MRVKVGGTWFEATLGHPIAIELSEADKTNIANMAPKATRYAVFHPADQTSGKDKLAWLAD